MQINRKSSKFNTSLFYLHKNFYTLAFERMQQRGVSRKDVEYFIKNGKVLKQAGEKYAYITEKGMAVPSEKGTLITTYSSAYYDAFNEGNSEKIIWKVGKMLKNREELLEVIKFGNDIKKVINKWDPMNLIYFDLDDEYEMEIKEIRDEIIIKKIMTVNNLSLCIRNIFKNKFSDEYSSKPNIEIEKSKEILDFSKKYNLLDIEFDNLKKIEIKIDNKNLDHYMEQYIKIKKNNK